MTGARRAWIKVEGQSKRIKDGRWRIPVVTFTNAVLMLSQFRAFLSVELRCGLNLGAFEVVRHLDDRLAIIRAARIAAGANPEIHCGECAFEGRSDFLGGHSCSPCVDII